MGVQVVLRPARREDDGRAWVTRSPFSEAAPSLPPRDRAPALAAHPKDPRTAAVNARIRNSRSGWGKELAGRPVDDQIAGYVERSRKEKEDMKDKGEGAAQRAKRQVLRALRVGVIIQHLRLVMDARRQRLRRRPLRGSRTDLRIARGLRSPPT